VCSGISAMQGVMWLEAFEQISIFFHTVYLYIDVFHIYFQKTAFPLGFYVVFVVKADDWDCSGYYETVTVARNKSLKFSIEPGITYRNYIISTVGTIVVFVLFYISFVVISVVYFVK
jgi:hypothetical protein